MNTQTKRERSSLNEKLIGQTMEKKIHTLRCGKTGSGKSEAMLCEEIATAVEGKSALVVLDPHGDKAKDLVLHCAERHLLHRVIYDRLADTDRTPSYEFLKASTHPDALQRYAEDDDRVRKFIALMIRRGGLKDASASPIIEKGLMDAARLFIYQDQWTYLPWMAQLYTPGSTVFTHMVEHCKDQDTKLQFMRFSMLNPQTKEYQTGPADRRLRAILMSPSFMVRCGLPSFDFDEAMKGKAIIILDGEGCNPDAAAVMMSAITLKVYDFCRRMHDYPVEITMDEAINAGLLGLQESQMLAEVRKWGMRFNILVQDLNFATPELRSNVLQNTHHSWFGQDSPETAALAAADVAKRIVDPLKVHHTEYRVRNADDGFEKISTTSKSIQKDKHNKTTGKTTNTGQSIVKKTREVTEAQDRYMSLSDQEVLAQQKLMNLGPGWRWDAGDDEPHYEPMEKHLWHHLSKVCGPLPEAAIRKLKDAKLQKAIEQVKSTSAYRTPELIPPPPPPSNPEPPKRRSGMR